MSRSFSRGYGRSHGGCGGWSSYDGPCGATDCSNCHPEGDGDGGEKTTETRTYHIARTAQAGIEPGDLYFRVTGFTYDEGGARTGYLNPRKVLVANPPGHKNHNPSTWAFYIRVYGIQCAARNLRRAVKSGKTDLWKSFVKAA